LERVDDDLRVVALDEAVGLFMIRDSGSMSGACLASRIRASRLSHRCKFLRQFVALLIPECRVIGGEASVWRPARNCRISSVKRGVAYGSSPENRVDGRFR
jgi:hypothetical protein